MSNIEKITGKDNPKIKFVKKVRDGKDRSRIFVEGLRLLDELLNTDAEIELCFFGEQFLNDPRSESLTLKLLAKGVSLYQTTDKLLSSMSDTVNSQGAIAIARRKLNPISEMENHLSIRDQREASFWIFLYEINNPANLGAILRTADAAGVDGVLISTGSADPYSPKSLRSSMGSSLKVKIYENAEAGKVIPFFKGLGASVGAADVKASKGYTDCDWTKPSLLVFGSEAHGLPNEVMQLIDEPFKIPMQNSVESLNLAVSAGIILFEARRQLNEKKG